MSNKQPISILPVADLDLTAVVGGVHGNCIPPFPRPRPFPPTLPTLPGPKSPFDLGRTLGAS